MSITYNVIVQEYQEDLVILNGNKYLLQVAKSISSPGGTAGFNVVYQSQILGPNMSVSWSESYALNWSTQIAAPGSEVVYSGSWKPCAIGASFDLDSNGFFQPNPNNPNADKNSLNVGKNNYAVAVNIIVGVQDPRNPGKFTPIWVDPSKLIVGAHGEFTPRETVQVWYSAGEQTATMISNKATGYDQVELIKPKWWFHYIAATGIWQNQDAPFPPDAKDPPAKEPRDDKDHKHPKHPHH